MRRQYRDIDNKAQSSARTAATRRRTANSAANADSSKRKSETHILYIAESSSSPEPPFAPAAG